MRKLLKYLGYTAIVTYAFLCAMLFWGINGKAYIDPSVMTYIIQAVAGVVIAIGAAIGIYWRKAKRKVQDKLGLDEAKEIESDEIIINDEIQE